MQLLRNGIGQLLRYMKDDSKDFVLALSPKYLPYVRAVDYSLMKLSIKVFIVSQTEIEQICYASILRLI